jgi:hypothetical protein
MPHRSYRWLCLVCLSSFAIMAHAEDNPVHPEVQWALDYQLPEHECRMPELRNSNEVAGRIEKFEREAKRYSKLRREVPGCRHRGSQTHHRFGATRHYSRASRGDGGKPASHPGIHRRARRERDHCQRPFGTAAWW